MTDQALTTQTERPRTAIAVGGNVGALIPQDIEQAFRIAQALAHSGMTPNGFKTPETCFVAIMAGAELGLPPFQSLQSFAIINNRPTLWGDALMAVVRTNGFKVREWLEGEGDAMEAFCEVTRPDNGDVAEASFSVDDAKTAGLWKKTGPWSTNPKRMLKMRARAFAIRDGAADVLRGFQIREEIEDYVDTPSIDRPTEGTGLLKKLEAGKALATEGFGIRDLNAEAGEAAPAPEPKPKGRKKKAEEPSALDTIAEAEPEIVEQVVADHAVTDAEEAAFEDARQDHVEQHGTLSAPETSVEGEGDLTRPVDPQKVREALEAARDGSGAYTEEMTEQFSAEQGRTEDALPGPAPAGVIYFLAGEEPYPSGRRAVWFNGKPNGSENADGGFPVYAEHPVEDAAPEAPVEDKPAETAFDALVNDLGEAEGGGDIVMALKTYFATEEGKAPEAKAKARRKAWSRVIGLNDGGAKIDPVADPFLLACFIEACEDAEVVEAQLGLARDQEWFKAGAEAMQTGVARAVMERVKTIRGE